MYNFILCFSLHTNKHLAVLSKCTSDDCTHCFYYFQGKDFENKKDEVQTTKGVDKNIENIPTVSQKLSKIKVEPEFSGADVKNLEEENEKDDSDIETMSDDDENDEGLDEVGNEDDTEKICGGEEGDDISNDEKEDDINSDIVQCDSTTDDLKSNSSKFVEEMMKDSKYVRKSERTNHSSGNGKKIITEELSRKTTSDKSKKQTDKSKKQKTLTKVKEENTPPGSSDKYTPSRKRQVKTTTSGSFVVEDLTPTKRKKTTANPTGIHLFYTTANLMVIA